MLVVTGVEEIRAFLHEWVSLAGHVIVCPDDREHPFDALDRHRPHLLLLDCDHDLADGPEFYERAHRAKCRVIIYGHSSARDDVRRFAERRGVEWLAAPVGHRTFRQTIERVLGG